MFSTDQRGRLSYAPFIHYQLPNIVSDDNGPAEFARRQRDTDDDGFGPPVFRRPLYRLRWPGESSKDVLVPGEIVYKWKWWKHPAAKPKYAGIPIREIHENWREAGYPPLHEDIAYHMAVNPGHLCDWACDEPKQPRPQVAGLPSKRVDEVLNARFAIDEKAMATLQYLHWMAESHYQHPFFKGFDTNIRETLYEFQHEAVRLFFYLLADYRYDAETRWWDRGLDRFVWQRLSCYFHWVGRTGRALYGWLSHIHPPGIRQDLVEEQMKDVLKADNKWVKGIDRVADEPTVGPSKED